MKKIIFIVLLMINFCPLNVAAQRGCCSRHGGVSNQCSNGRQVCNDGSVSPSCPCEDYSSYIPSTSSSGNSSSGNSNSSSSAKSVSIPSYKYGCTNSNALNYDPSATKDDGSCIEKVTGCMDSNARNYNNLANVSDSSCEYETAVKETKKIIYKTKYKYTDKLDYNVEKVIKKGEKGIKEVTYKIVTNESGNQISKEKVSETIITKPVNQIVEKSSKTSQNDIAIYVIWIISLFVAIIYSTSHKKANLLINKIKNKTGNTKVVWYFVYIFFVIGPIIDLVLIILNIAKEKGNKIEK